MGFGGERNSQAKLTDDDVKLIKSRYLAGESQYKIAVAFGVRQPAISRILAGVRWSDTASIAEARKARNPTDMDRFNRSYKVMPSGCWEWQLSKLQPPHLPYGQFKIRIDGKAHNRTAHRWIYQQLHGEIPDGIHVCHHCDNPSCVNPEHLFAGTALDNMQDRNRKGRQADVRGEANPVAILTDEDVRQILEHRRQGKRAKEIARLFGVSHQHISKITSGKRRSSI